MDSNESTLTADQSAALREMEAWYRHYLEQLTQFTGLISVFPEISDFDDDERMFWLKRAAVWSAKNREHVMFNYLSFQPPGRIYLRSKTGDGDLIGDITRLLIITPALWKIFLDQIHQSQDPSLLLTEQQQITAKILAVSMCNMGATRSAQELWRISRLQISKDDQVSVYLALASPRRDAFQMIFPEGSPSFTGTLRLQWCFELLVDCIQANQTDLAAWIRAHVTFSDQHLAALASLESQIIANRLAGETNSTSPAA
jgi:hypothetical protein